VQFQGENHDLVIEAQLYLKQLDDITRSKASNNNNNSTNSSHWSITTDGCFFERIFPVSGTWHVYYFVKEGIQLPQVLHVLNDKRLTCTHAQRPGITFHIREAVTSVPGLLTQCSIGFSYLSFVFPGALYLKSGSWQQ
jgi:hypothetical protein